MKFRNIKNLFFVVPFGILLASCSPTIQRTVNVTKNISSTSYGSNLLGEMFAYEKANKYSLSKECMNYSISQEDLDIALENGAKIITSSQWEQVVLYTSYKNPTPIVNRTNEKGKCLGLSYIIEGKKSLLNKFAPKK